MQEQQFQQQYSYLCFDTETTGLPQMKGFNQYYPPQKQLYYDKSRIVELGYIIYDKKQNIIKQVDSLIKPNGFNIPQEASDIHGISHEQAYQNGIEIEKALQQLEQDLKDVKILIAHNLGFDYHVVLSEAYRLGMQNLIDLIDQKEKHCTMMLGKKALGLKRNPKLIVLYEQLLQEPFQQNHRALDDCIHCGKCYFEIINKYSDKINLQDETNIEDYVIQFGKHKYRTLKEVYKYEYHYCKWVLEQKVCTGNIYELQRRLKIYDIEQKNNNINNSYNLKQQIDLNNLSLQQLESYLIQFGKYNQKSLIEVYSQDIKYCEWALSQRNSNNQKLQEFRSYLQIYKLKKSQINQQKLNVNSLEFDFQKLSLDLNTDNFFQDNNINNDIQLNQQD